MAPLESQDNTGEHTIIGIGTKVPLGWVAAIVVGFASCSWALYSKLSDIDTRLAKLEQRQADSERREIDRTR